MQRKELRASYETRKQKDRSSLISPSQIGWGAWGWKCEKCLSGRTWSSAWFWSSQFETDKQTGEGPKEGHKEDQRFSKHHQKKTEGLRSFNPGIGKAQGDLITVFQYLKGAYKDNGRSLHIFTRSHMKKTRGNCVQAASEKDLSWHKKDFLLLLFLFYFFL